MTTANGRPWSRTSSGSSTAAQSIARSRVPRDARTISTRVDGSGIAHIIIRAWRIEEARMTKKAPAAGQTLENVSEAVTRWTGSSSAFATAAGVVALWALTGPLFGFSNTWQLVINTGTTIVTFLMVFLIQRAQNKDARAMQVKLNELVAAMEGASNRLIDVEGLSERELATIGKYYKELARLASRDVDLTKSHSIEEAEKQHTGKQQKTRRG